MTSPCIYEIISTATTDGDPLCLYVGSSMIPAQRFRKHRYLALHGSQPLYRLLREVGNWEIRVIEEFPGIERRQLREKEEQARVRLRPLTNVRAAFTDLQGPAYASWYRQKRPREYFNASLRRWRAANPDRVMAHREAARLKRLERNAVEVMTAMQSADQ